jgi:hypothetical protein
VTSLAVPFVFELPRSLLDVLLFCALGFFGGFGHYILMRAFQLAPASVLSPLGYPELVTATILGYLIWHNIPDAFTWLGVAIVMASGIAVASPGRHRNLQCGRSARQPCANGVAGHLPRTPDQSGGGVVRRVAQDRDRNGSTWRLR